jgi:hypothetical protein
MTQRQVNLVALVALVLAIVALSIGLVQVLVPPTDPLVGLGTTHFTAISAKDFTATDDLSVADDTSLGDALTVAGASDLRGNLSDGGGTLTIGDDVMIDGAADAIQLTVQGYTTQTHSLLVLEQSDGSDKLAVSDDGDLVFLGGVTVGATEASPSDGATITPTNAYALYNISSTGNLTITLAACSTDGEVVFLAGDDANDVVIADTNVRTSTGAALTLNQYDVAGFICVDTEWIELLLLTDS